jgi:hypothetical protein
MLCNLYSHKNDEGQLGEAAMSPPSSRMAFSHDFLIGKLPRGHLVLLILEQSKGCFVKP